MSNQLAHNVAFQLGGGRCLPSDLIKTVFARRPLHPHATELGMGGGGEETGDKSETAWEARPVGMMT